MECTKCGRDAVMHAAYSGAHLCDAHFAESVERRVRRRVREDGLVPRDATPDDPETWVVGLSGGFAPTRFERTREEPVGDRRRQFVRDDVERATVLETDEQ